MLLACAGNGNGGDNSFIGTWDEVGSDGEPTGEQVTFSRNGNGKVTYSGISGSLGWTEENGHFFISVSICGMNETLEFEYEISGNTMYLTLLPDGTTGTYVRH